MCNCFISLETGKLYMYVFWRDHLVSLKKQIWKKIKLFGWQYIQFLFFFFGRKGQHLALVKNLTVHIRGLFNLLSFKAGGELKFKLKFKM